MERIDRARKWLKESVFPLWLTQGIDPTNGSFVESLNVDGTAMNVAKRAMVQCRQIYSFNEASKLEILTIPEAKQILRRASLYFVDKYSDRAGAFIHAIDEKGEPSNTKLDLYTQAFALFGLANAYEALGDQMYKTRALNLVAYLRKERQVPGGGFTEVVDGKNAFQSNPHMHLFEAVIAWMRVDKDPIWKTLGTEIYDLCKNKFMANEAGLIAEQFDATWTPRRENGFFYWEPGHQCEWAWLMLEFAKVGGTDPGLLPGKIFLASEKQGVIDCFAVDEMWSDGTPKSLSKRFWPQTERIKAAVSLGKMAAADEAFEALFKYFETMRPGLWEDQILADGTFKRQPLKASSLYHIICALSEYIQKR